MEKKTGRFNLRAFVTLVIAFSGIVLPVSGYFNHTYQFSPMTVERHAWMSAHNVMGSIFVIFAIWHIVLNRRPLLSHMRGLSSTLRVVSREAVLAGALVAGILLLFVGHAFLVR